MDTKTIVSQIVAQLTPYIVAGIVSLIGTIGATVANMLHRTASNKALADKLAPPGPDAPPPTPQAPA